MPTGTQPSDRFTFLIHQCSRGQPKSYALYNIPLYVGCASSVALQRQRVHHLAGLPAAHWAYAQKCPGGRGMCKATAWRKKADSGLHIQQRPHHFVLRLEGLQIAAGVDGPGEHVGAVVLTQRGQRASLRKAAHSIPDTRIPFVLQTANQDERHVHPCHRA